MGVIHRDLKPSNLLVTSDDRLKVTDFGLARVFRELGGGEEGVGVGTLAYMAPEQLRGERGADGRADVYSFGLLLYEMLEGRNPLQASAPAEQIERALQLVPPPLEDVPPALAALVSRCVSKEAERRPSGFREVLGHLAAIARGLEHRFHVDPATIEPPERPTGLVLTAPAMRPRHPRAGEPFALELRVRGDVGPGPVHLRWRNLRDSRDCRVLSPERARQVRVAAGGTVDLVLRLHMVADRECRRRIEESLLIVEGPQESSRHVVPAFDVDVAFAFHLPLVGRSRELARMRGLLRDGRGALLFEGGVGSGRSRMLVECEHLGVEAGYRVIKSRALATGMRPMRVLNDTARGLLDGGGGEAVPSALNDLLPEGPATVEYFTRLLGGGEISLEEVEEAPVGRHWLALLKAVSGEGGPVLLLLDDLHLADEAARRIVNELAAGVEEAALPVVLIATAAERAGLKDLECHTLGPLPTKQVRKLVDAGFPGHSFEDDAPWLVTAIASATGGNPFHVSEIVSALREELITGEEGDWRVHAALTPERLRDLVPDALDAAVRRRLDGLSPESREVLEIAALAGEEFDGALLRDILKDVPKVDGALREMEDANVARLIDPDRDRYRFVSAVIATVVARALEPALAKLLHLRVADGKIRVYRGDRRLRRSLAIAQHLKAAGEDARSLSFTLAGCQRLLGLHLPGRARQLLAAARPLAAAAAESERARFDYLYGLACEATGDYEEGLEALTRFVEAGITVTREPRSLPRAYARLGDIHRARGEFERAQYSHSVARQLLEDLGDLRALAFVVCSLAEIAIDLGRYRVAEEHLGEARKVSKLTGNGGAAAEAAILAGRMALDLEQPKKARGFFEESQELARRLADKTRLALSRKGLGICALRGGYLEMAAEYLNDAADLHAAMGDRPGLASVLVHIGTLYRALGRVDRALANFRRAQRIFTEVGHREGAAAARHSAGLVLRAWGKTTYAVRELASAAEEYQLLGVPDRAVALRDLGAALVDAGVTRAARIALARADRGTPPGAARRAQRVKSRVLRVRLALAAGELERAAALGRRALRNARRTTGHEARIAANLAVGEAALAQGRRNEAQTCAARALAFAREEGDHLAGAEAERILLGVAAARARPEEVALRAHRVARAYTGRADVGDGPPRLLLALARAGGPRAARYLRAARHCYSRMEAEGYRAPKLDGFNR
ncbi:MAG: protein kinase domain-containing protein [Planctomycetota bacterium]